MLEAFFADGTVEKQSKMAGMPTTLKSFGVVLKFLLFLTVGGFSCSVWADANRLAPNG